MSSPARLVLNTAASVFTAGLAYSLVEPHFPTVHAMDVVLENLPPECEGLKIAQMSDIHCSAITSTRLVARAVEKCNQLKPDVIALTGDFVSRRNSYSHFTGARMWAKPVMHYAHAVAEALGGCVPAMGSSQFQAITTIPEAIAMGSWTRWRKMGCVPS